MKIVAIGGGEIGRKDKKTKKKYPIETLPIDKEVVKLSGKKHPKLLFLPQASNDSESYYKVIQSYYGKRLGCETDVLYLIDRDKSSEDKFVSRGISKKEIERKILSADIIYVGGGSGTLKMLNLWRGLGVDKLLKKAAKNNIVLSGVSAGAICWFRHGHSDSVLAKEKRYIQLDGLGLIPLFACPHYDRDGLRRDSLLKMMGSYDGRAVALKECAAIEVVDGKYRVLSSRRGANAYILYKDKGKLKEEIIPVSNEFKSLSELVGK